MHTFGLKIYKTLALIDELWKFKNIKGFTLKLFENLHNTTIKYIYMARTYYLNVFIQIETSDRMYYSNRIRVWPALTDQVKRISFSTYNIFDVPTSIELTNQLNTKMGCVSRILYWETLTKQNNWISQLHFLAKWPRLGTPGLSSPISDQLMYLWS